MPLETQRVCAHFLLKMASSDHQIPKKSAARPYKGGDPPPTPTQIATLTATIMHAWFGSPVDVPGTEYTVNVREDENHPFARTTQG